MKTSVVVIATVGLMAFASVTQARPTAAPATPMTGIIDSGGSYTVIHLGANPGGVGTPQDWAWFAPDQQINLFLDNGVLTLDAAQNFAVSIEASASVFDVSFDSMMLDLNDDDGFSHGYLSYSVNQMAGTFFFENLNYNSIFNTSSLDGNELTVYVWGGDEENGLGIDLALSVTVLPVPEPGIVALMLLGFAGMTMTARRREVVALKF